MLLNAQSSSTPQSSSLPVHETKSTGQCSINDKDHIAPFAAPVDEIFKDTPSLPTETSGFPDVLPEDNSRCATLKNGKNKMWFFILRLLDDPTKKSVVVWTGLQRRFRVRDKAMLCHLWSRHNENKEDITWVYFRRCMRMLEHHGLLMAVPSGDHKGRNEDGEFGFLIEPASYLKMTREALDKKIRLHCENGPLTVRSPIDSSWGYRVGARLQVFPILLLDEDGNVSSPLPEPSFITVLPAPRKKIVRPKKRTLRKTIQRYDEEDSPKSPCAVNGGNQEYLNFMEMTNVEVEHRPIDHGILELAQDAQEIANFPVYSSEMIDTVRGLSPIDLENEPESRDDDKIPARKRMVLSTQNGAKAAGESKGRVTRSQVTVYKCPYWSCSDSQANFEDFLYHLEESHKTTPEKDNMQFSCTCGFLGDMKSTNWHKFKHRGGSIRVHSHTPHESHQSPLERKKPRND